MSMKDYSAELLKMEGGTDRKTGGNRRRNHLAVPSPSPPALYCTQGGSRINPLPRTMDDPALFMPHLEFTQNLGLTQDVACLV